MANRQRMDQPHNVPAADAEPGEDATLDDVDRLMQLQETVKEAYAEIGRLKKKISATVKRRKERNRLELERLRQARTAAENRGDFGD